ncbi:Acetate kinase [Roseovarius sp. THAF9]|uniref:acetate/propionate family kinase n=1 Tax=Roseovarius sp. THAF9 TaxID=2587847 RepID=UPI001268BE0E|nr:acetate kinase [Roseovarius sp. THAF9]QFT91270.1 Acetate kinase [Roseovarius sp. THAF9]
MILVVNAGSSSIKVELFTPALESVLSGSLTEIGGQGRLSLGGETQGVSVADHTAALGLILERLEAAGHPVSSLIAAGHRVVHGGAHLTAPERLTEEVIAKIEAVVPLAPLHNPHNLSGVRALAKLAPDLPQFASFDTAFHATNPQVAVTYALPQAERDKGIRRYGFHGLSYAGMVAQFGDDLPRRLLGLHLGNGASLCAMVEGKSVANSMGYSPLDGLVMGTRTGCIDGMAVLRLAEDHGIEKAGTILNKESGLKGLAGTNDMATLLSREDEDARFAVEHFCYWAARQAGSAIAAMHGVDAVAFTGGIGENAGTIRDRIMDHLTWLGEIPVHVVPADEERQIARDVVGLLPG